MSLVMLLVACTQPKDPHAAPETCNLDDLPLATDYVPTASIEVRTDDRGVVHLYAQNDRDLFYAQGYQLAKDRLFVLDTWRRAALGTLSEVRGEESVSDDLAARAFGLHHYGCENLKKMYEERPDEFGWVTAYVSGVNARVAEIRAGEAELPWGFGPGELDYLPEPFAATDIAAIGRRITLGYSDSFQYDLLYGVFQALVPNYPDFPVFAPGPDRFITTDAPPDSSAAHHAPAPRGAGVPDLDALAELLRASQRMHSHLALGGSNNWAVNGRNTANGRPLIANDPHSTLTDPGTLSLMHLDSASAGGSFDVVGFSFPMIPGIQLGHNEKLAWAATTAFADQADLWAVTIDGDTAEIGGEELPITDTDEVIRVRQADGTVAEQTYTIRSVDGYGTLLPEEVLPLPPSVFGADALLVNWVGFSPSSELWQYLDLDRAQTLDEFEAAIDEQRVGMHNWLGATADGIRYHTHGLVPDRGPVGSRPAANTIMDGNDASTFWTGDYVDPELLPHLDGTQDFIVTANNDPFGNTADNDPLNDDVYYGSFFAPSYRAERIWSELDRMVAAGPVGVEDLQSLQMDDYSLLADRLIPLLTDVASRIDTEDSLAEFRGRTDIADAVARLEAWDRHAKRGSAETALFRAWHGYLARESLSSDLSILLGALDEEAPVSLAKLTEMTLTDGTESVLHGRGDYYVISSLDRALAWLSERAEDEGVTTFTSTEMHQARFDTLYGDDATLPVDGDESTVNVAGCQFWAGDVPADTCQTVEGAVFRTVTSFDDDGTPVTTFTMPYGPDGDVAMWADGVYDSLAFRRDEVEARTVDAGTIGAPSR